MIRFRFLIVLILLASSINYSVAQITEIGLASFYADKFDGRITASGETFDQNKMTAAHRTFPFGTVVKVTNKENNKTVTVTINDRGPFVKDRVIDLSKAAAKKLEFTQKGIAQVKVEVVSLGKSEVATNTYPKPSAQQSAAATPPAQTATTPIVAASVNSTPSENTAFEYYKLQSEFIVPTGFGIQIASYQEASNLLKRCDEIRKEVRKDIIIQVGENDGNKVYRIIIGTFETREAANDFNTTLKRSFNGSFVIAF
jgi:rare lipoprotein A